MTFARATLLSWLMLLMALGSVPAQQPPAPASKTKPPPVAALAYHPNGKYLAAAGLGEVYVIDVATGDVALKLTGQTAKVTALAFSRNGSRLTFTRHCGR